MPAKKILTNSLDLLVLCCLAVAQPLFDLLGRNAEFFTARNSDRFDFILLTISIVFLIPLILNALELVALTISAGIYNYLHRILIWILVVMLLFPSMKLFYRMFGIGWILFPMILAAVIAEGYNRLRSRGLALAYLCPIILIIPGLFLFHSPVRSMVLATQASGIRYPDVRGTAPVVMVVFDEFPLTSLLNEHGEINALRYPGFAELAKCATWYRNASTVAASTLHAVPAILDGRLPDPGQKLLPLAKDHPHSVFTLLGGSYRMNVVENNTHICPENLCGPGSGKSGRIGNLKSLLSDIGVLYLYIQLPADLTRSLPNITQSWKEFTVAKTRTRKQIYEVEDLDILTSFKNRRQIFEEFIGSIQPGSRHTLNFIHSMLPHAPWEYLPSGKKHSLAEDGIRGLVGVNDRGMDINQWKDDPWAIEQAQKKHLLQVEMVDTLIGKLLRHLREVGLYQNSLIVITADHGTSFHAHVSRRAPSPENYVDIMAIPLFIKFPKQEKGAIDNSSIETIDILPTMAEALGIRVPWKIDGRSVLKSDAPRRLKRRMILEDGTNLIVDADLSLIQKSVREKLSIFGHTSEDLFRVGLYPELIGQRVDRFNVTRSTIKCDVYGRSYFNSVDLNSQFILSNIKGMLSGELQSLVLPLSVAISVNDVIAGVTPTYQDSQGKIRFSLVVSDKNFRSGQNRVRIYLVSKTGNGYVLAETEDTQIPAYRWGDTLKFGANGNAGVYLAGGWSKPEDRITWTNSKTAELVLPVSASRRIIKLRLFAGTYLKPGILDRQTVKLYINRQPAARWILDTQDFGIHEAFLPIDITRDSSSIIVTLEMPDAVSPNAIGDGDDARQLGLAAGWVSLSEIQP